MKDKLCGNCDYSSIIASGFRVCVRHRMCVIADANACNDYFNYKKTQIYNQIKDVLKV